MIKIVIKIVTRKVLPKENSHGFIYRNQAFNDWLLHKYFSNCIVRWGTGFSCEGGGLIYIYTYIYICFSQKAGWMVKLRLAETGAQHNGKSIWHVARVCLGFLNSCWTVATLGKASAFDTISDVNNLGMPPWIVLPFCQGLDCRFERDGHIFLVWTEAWNFRALLL